MYGVPDNLPVEQFVGATLVQLCVGAYDLQLRFESGSRDSASPQLQVEGAWRLLDSAGRTRFSWARGDRQDAAALQDLIGQSVSSARVHAPDYFALVFGNGDTLTVLDDSEEFESFNISPGPIV